MKFGKLTNAGVRLLIAFLSASLVYVVVQWILGWTSELLGFNHPIGEFLGILLVAISPLGFGLLLFPVLVIVLYWQLPKLFN
jgi:hypothetical protein